MRKGIYKRGSIYWLRYAGPDGRIVYESTGTNSKQLAEKILSIRKTEIITGKYNIKPKNGPLFRDFSHQWLEEKKVRLKNSTFVDYRSIIDRYLIPAFNRPLSKITEGDIEQFVSTLEGKSPQRINNILVPLKGILKTAHRRGFIGKNPAEFIKPLKTARQETMPLSLEEVGLFLETVDSHFKDYFLVAFFTGLRPSEQLALKWDGIDFSKAKITVNEAIVRGVEDSPKTVDSKRTIDMLSPAKEALQRQAEKTFLKGPYVFLSREGSILDINNLRNRIWYPALKKAKIKRRTMYQARHTFATLMLASGENPLWVAKMMGHTNTEMLFDRYSKYIPNLTHKDGSAFYQLYKNYTMGKLSMCKPEDTIDVSLDKKGN